MIRWAYIKVSECHKFISNIKPTGTSMQDRERLCERVFSDLKQERSVLKKTVKMTRRQHRSEKKLPSQYVDRLERALKGIDVNTWSWGQYFQIDRAILHNLYAGRNYRQLHDCIIQACNQSWHDGRLPKDLYIEFENLWASASYVMYRPENKSVDSLTPVDRYRIRKKYPCPLTIWVGGRRYTISDEAKTLLESTFREQEKPNRQIKDYLAKLTGQDITTVSNWFKNRRQRHTRGSSIGSSGSISGRSLTTSIKSEAESSTTENMNSEQPQMCHHKPAAHDTMVDTTNNDCSQYLQEPSYYYQTPRVDDNAAITPYSAYDHHQYYDQHFKPLYWQQADFGDYECCYETCGEAIEQTTPIYNSNYDWMTQTL